MQKLFSREGRFFSLLTRLIIDLYFDFFSGVIDRIDSKIAQFPPLQGLFNTLKMAFMHEDAAYKRHKLIETEEMKALDKTRKGIVSELFLIIKAKLNTMTPADRAAAELLKVEIIDTYKAVNRVTPPARTAFITNICADISNAKCTPAATRLNLTGTVSELVSANAAYITKFNERADEEHKIKETGSATDARTGVNNAFQDLLEGIQAVFIYNILTANDEDLHEKLVELADIINANMDQVRRSYALHRKKKKDEGITDPDDLEDDDDDDYFDLNEEEKK
jgi:hypothetical protein